MRAMGDCRSLDCAACVCVMASGAQSAAELVREKEEVVDVDRESVHKQLQSFLQRTENLGNTVREMAAISTMRELVKTAVEQMDDLRGDAQKLAADYAVMYERLMLLLAHAMIVSSRGSQVCPVPVVSGGQMGFVADNPAIPPAGPLAPPPGTILPIVPFLYDRDEEDNHDHPSQVHDQPLPADNEEDEDEDEEAEAEAEEEEDEDEEDMELDLELADA